MQSEQTNVYANHALALAYFMTGDKTAAIQQCYTLKYLNADATACTRPAT